MEITLTAKVPWYPTPEQTVEAYRQVAGVVDSCTF